MGSRLDLSESRDVIGHVIIRFPIGHFISVVLWNQASVSITVSEIFNGECDAMVDMTLNDLYANVKVILAFWYQSIPNIGCDFT